MSRLRVGPIVPQRFQASFGCFSVIVAAALFLLLLSYFSFVPSTVPPNKNDEMEERLKRDGYIYTSGEVAPAAPKKYERQPVLGAISGVLGLGAIWLAYLAGNYYLLGSYRYKLLAKRAFTFPCSAKDEVEAKKLLDEITTNYLDCPTDRFSRLPLYHDEITFERAEDSAAFSKRFFEAYFTQLLTLGRRGTYLISLSPQSFQLPGTVTYADGYVALRFITISIYQSGRSSEFTLTDHFCKKTGWYEAEPLKGKDASQLLLTNLYEEIKTSLYGEALGMPKTKIDPIVSPDKNNKRPVVNNTHSRTSGANLGGEAEQADTIEDG